ncbi:ribbon-helix-helix domain-containing protein [Risungbinella massiliensis]|uniref:ribbon-helix-helix domain-containing protein n=1 Tax=Risungbinella massiliensis TaxID=1329796 RepID=UPI0005CBE712|nr:Arc family DNA-binding protein [Risungbinella massiliensis]
MSSKKRFLLRLDPNLYEAIEKWAADEFRSVNAQIEFLLRQAVQKEKRMPKKNRDNSPE